MVGPWARLRLLLQSAHSQQMDALPWGLCGGPGGAHEERVGKAGVESTITLSAGGGKAAQTAPSTLSPHCYWNKGRGTGAVLLSAKKVSPQGRLDNGHHVGGSDVGQ